MNRVVFLIGAAIGALSTCVVVKQRREVRLRLLDVVAGDWAVARNVRIAGSLYATAPAVISRVRLDAPPDGPGIVVDGEEFAVIRNTIVMGSMARGEG